MLERSFFQFDLFSPSNFLFETPIKTPLNHSCTLTLADEFLMQISFLFNYIYIAGLGSQF